MTDDWTTRFRIYKNAYDKRINVHLFNAENSDTYKTFQKNLATNLFSQVEYVASDIETLYVLSKAASVELLAQVGGLVAKYELSKKLGLNLFMYWAGEQGGQAAMDKLGINGVFGLQNPKFLQYFDQSDNLIINSVFINLGLIIIEILSSDLQLLILIVIIEYLYLKEACCYYYYFRYFFVNCYFK